MTSIPTFLVTRPWIPFPGLSSARISSRPTTAKMNTQLTQKRIMEAAQNCDVAQLSRESRQLTERVHEIVNEQGATPMHIAAQIDCVDAVSALFEVARGTGGATVQYGHNDKAAHEFVSMADLQGCTALHYAATAGALLAAQRLLQLGADSKAVDKLGRTPTDCASAAGHVELAQMISQW